ncbi:tRNA nucleotidyltransferase [Marinomonas pollencensis]|uniref:tRNA nucleotidyltransferase (CCA-adding enzyme) n=1 Tax=Marinomonas pollencensis TaxID=491954 RepID=A0A3E0DRD6_9GAMM|nr:tRNA nucleotidyltransferase [Marinomonas pollencensis]REG84885.1 tRNA nucleotidyltransferase (CCA-adding enzyme) [Marinomonas pollencensis]
MSDYQVYLVGGAVRDQLLGLTVKDHDWVVTGATPEQLETIGYQQVGKQFPVFLHPNSKEEYALARKEKKQGQGYTGFICDFSPDISLEEDLERRDLTINAIAQDKDGQLIDPFNGQQDLKDRLFRHVSEAFVEDPLRVLRVARFAARFAEFGFRIAPETLRLMQTISQSGELSSLTPERIWKELEKALLTTHADVFFDVLVKAEALPALFPEWVWQPSQALRSQLQQPDLSAAQRWAILCQHTPLNALEVLQKRLKCPNQFKGLAEQARAFIERQTIPMPAAHWENWLTQVSAIKKPQPYQRLIEVLSLITRTQQNLWLELRNEIAQINAANLIKQGLSGAELGTALKAARVLTLSEQSHPFVTHSD